jgi:PEP-CTERM motif
MRRSIARSIPLVAIVAMLVGFAHPALAAPFFFSTGNPDGLIATLSRPASAGLIQTETADDFILSQQTRITSATFVGLLPLGAPLTNITQVEIEFYHVFPKDSVNPPSGNVLTRVNSPADVEIGAATRDSVAGTLSFLASLLSANFTVNNSVVNGIHPFPGQFTGGEGSVSGEEVSISVTFTSPVDLPPDHYFFRPEAGLTSGNFLWLSAPKPIVGGSGPFNPDLQSWTRNDDLAPDWSRIGTDITHQGPFNATFSLTGETVPEPSALLLLGSGLLGLGAYSAWRRKR